MSDLVPCNYPGCADLVPLKSRTGLCRCHVHTKELCRCRFCQAEMAALRKKQEQERRHAGTVLVQVRNRGLGYNETEAIRMRRPPWEE